MRAHDERCACGDRGPELALFDRCRLMTLQVAQQSDVQAEIEPSSEGHSGHGQQVRRRCQRVASWRGTLRLERLVDEAGSQPCSDGEAPPGTVPCVVDARAKLVIVVASQNRLVLPLAQAESETSGEPPRGEVRSVAAHGAGAERQSLGRPGP